MIPEGRWVRHQLIRGQAHKADKTSARPRINWCLTQNFLPSLPESLINSQFSSFGPGIPHPPNLIGAIVGNQERSVFGYKGADRPAPGRTWISFIDDPPGHEVLDWT